jgi:Tol biopolymer transport system component/DNA-binding winged helix-turn-helix (wHTH) protein
MMTEPTQKPDLRTARGRRGATRIGEWILHPDLGVLRTSSDEVRLNPKSLHVLLVLLDAGDKGVSRDDLLDQVWGQNYPSDGVISRAMADLRAAFGEKAGEQRYIRTLPKFGYQLVAERCAVEAETVPPASRVPATHLARYKHHYLLGAVALLASILLPQLIRMPDVPQSSTFVLSGAKPLTSAPGLEHQPRLVPGSDWVVHAVQRRDRGDWDLFRVSLDDGTLQPVAVTPDVHEHGPAISPLGDELAYVRLSESACDLVVQSITLGVPEVITQCTQKFPTLVDWSPAGNQLAFTIAQSDEADSLRRIYLINRFSGESRRLTDAVSPTGTDFYPRFSPSGNRVAFLRGEPQPDHRTTLWSVDVESGAEVQLTDLPAQVGGMAWLDDQRLIYSVSEAGRMRGWLLNIDTLQKQPIESPEFLHPEFDAGRRLLVAAELRNDLDLVLLDSTGTTRNVGQSTSDDHHGSLSPDEKWIAFISRRSGFDELWIASAENDAVRQLTRFEGATVRYPDWHPDGSKVLITVQSDADERLYTVDIVSGTATEIATGFANITTPRWISDGWVAGCRDESGWSICVGDDTAIKKVADGYYRPHPSGADDVYVVNDVGTLFRLSLADGSTTKILDGLPGRGRYGWEVENDTLYFLTGGETGNTGRLLKVDIGGGEPELLFVSPMPVADTALSIGKQRGTILLTLFRTSSDDLVVYEGVGFDLNNGVRAHF